MQAISYAKWIKGDEDYDGELLPLVQVSFFADEVNNAGLEKEDQAFLEKFPSGYYKITYNYYLDQDYCDGYPCTPEYMVLEYIDKAEKSWYAVYLYIKSFYLNPVSNFIWSVFSRNWSIDFLYGGVGISSPTMFLPQSLWYRFLNPNKFARWGKEYTEITLRRMY